MCCCGFDNKEDHLECAICGLELSSLDDTLRHLLTIHCLVIGEVEQIVDFSKCFHVFPSLTQRYLAAWRASLSKSPLDKHAIAFRTGSDASSEDFAEEPSTVASIPVNVIFCPRLLVSHRSNVLHVV